MKCLDKVVGKNGNGILIGPKVDLSNQNLSNLDLSRANMTQVIIYKTIIILTSKRNRMSEWIYFWFYKRYSKRLGLRFF